MSTESLVTLSKRSLERMRSERDRLIAERDAIGREASETYNELVAVCGRSKMIGSSMLSGAMSGYDRVDAVSESAYRVGYTSTAVGISFWTPSDLGKATPAKGVTEDMAELAKVELEGLYETITDLMLRSSEQANAFRRLDEQAEEHVESISRLEGFVRASEGTNAQRQD